MSRNPEELVMHKEPPGQQSFAELARHLAALGGSADATANTPAPTARTGLQQGGPGSSQPQANTEEIGHDL